MKVKDVMVESVRVCRPDDTHCDVLAVLDHRDAVTKYARQRNSSRSS
jgi:hypothetical protein